MTEGSSLRTYADPQLSAVAFAHTENLLANGLSPPDGVADDRIKCVCGYEDDDGSTVFCEECHTWQHIRCYYPDKPPTEDAVHECVDCRPRAYDARGAAERQRQWRELQAITIQRSKPRLGKSHKKKVKDIAHNGAHVNGWPSSAGHDLQSGIEGTSANARDQPPPAKRPKTSHKSSGSVISLSYPSILGTGTRKRAGSGVLNGQSPTRSSIVTSTNGYPDDYFSPEFMQLHQQPPPQHVDANSFTDLAIANDLSLWLSDPDALHEVSNGKHPSEVFLVPSMSLEELELTAPVITKQTYEDMGLTIRGQHPVIQYLTLETSVPAGNYIGELRGRIGRRLDYINAPSGRWPSLRHPEPFVFFPPHLPIYIDARCEGTMLRYARRSCDPNMRMQIFITKKREYHFCFVSTRDIGEGEEITINWDVLPDIKTRLEVSWSNGNIKREGIQGKDASYISHWATGVLASFGNCACNRPEGECALHRFDRRVDHHFSVPHPPALKPSTSRRAKKSAHQASPLGTGYTNNSRASSEAINRGEQEDDNVDSRSVSGSSRSKPSSRDITPMTHTNTSNTGLGVEMSDRERRKLMQYEDLFKKQDENDEQQGNRRKKRHSAGSTLNTPSIAASVSVLEHRKMARRVTKHTTQKQLGFPDPSAASPPAPIIVGSGKNGELNTHHPSDSSINVQRPPEVKSRQHSPVGASSSRPRQTVRPVYTDASMQTEDEYSLSLEPPPLPLQRKPYVSFKQRLLKRTREERLRWEQQQQQQARDQDMKKEKSVAYAEMAYTNTSVQAQPSQKADSVSPDTDSAMCLLTAAPPEPLPATSTGGVSQTAVQEDVEMEDAAGQPPDQPSVASPRDSVPAVTEPLSENVPQTSHPPIQPPLPPWPSDASSAGSELRPSPKPAELRVQLPPIPSFPSQSTLTSSIVDTPGSLTGATIAQSPSSVTGMPPLFSPAVASVVAPSPRKKMSLSDYTKKKKNEALSAVQTYPTTISSNAATLVTARTDSTGSILSADQAGSPQPAMLRASSTVIEEVDATVLPSTADAATDKPQGVADVEMGAG